MKIAWMAAVAAAAAAGAAFAMEPVTIADQGSFMAGGTVITAPGKYRGNTEPLNMAGQTLHGDHAYVFYQKPLHAHDTALVFLHGYGQSGKTWETTPDGRDGFQNIFLEKGYKTYIADQPRRGRAGQSAESRTIAARPDDQLWYNNFRIGQWPQKFANVQVQDDAQWRDQFFRQMTPDTGAYDNDVISNAMKAVFDKAGDGIFITPSQGGGPGWYTAVKSDHVKGIIAIEPGTFLFPEGQVPPAEKTTSPFPAAGIAVPMDDFMRLTRIPILILFGDNIPAEQTDVWGLDNWRVRLNLARKWVDLVNRHGGDAELVYLPDKGIYGNTHFMMSDLNNRDVADVMEQWIKEKQFT